MDNIIPNKYILVHGVKTYNDHWNGGKGDIRKDAIVFVVDKNEGNAIYTHGYKFGGGSQNNESQSGGSQQPSEEQSDNTSGKKTVYYGFNANSLQSKQLSINDTLDIRITLSDLNSEKYFFLRIPADWEIDTFVQNGVQPVPYGRYNDLDGESVLGYSSANPLEYDEYIFKITFNLVEL